MSKKFFIVKDIDIEELNKQIAKFECKIGENPYLFMNHTTIEEISKEYLKKSPFVDSFIIIKRPAYTTAIYNGYKVFEDDNLAFGEIEIR